MGVVGCMRENRHVTAHRDEETGFGVGSVVVVNRSAGYGTRLRRGYAGSSAFLRIDNVHGVANGMCDGLRVRGQRQEFIMQRSKLPRARFAAAGGERRVEKRSSVHDTGGRSRIFDVAEEPRVDIERDRAARVGRVSRYAVPRAVEPR